MSYKCVRTKKNSFFSLITIFYAGLVNCPKIFYSDNFFNGDYYPEQFLNNEQNLNYQNNECCHVCYEEVKEEDKITLECGHFFCKECCYNNILQKIKTNIEKIYCMTCSNPDNKIEKKSWRFFTKDQCLKILKDEGPKENFEVIKQSYEIWEKRAEINSSNGTIKACPYKLKIDNETLDCTGILRKDEHNQYSKCDICTNEFCFKCLRDRDEHEKMKCEEYLKEMKKKDDEIFLKVYGKNNIKKCPHCDSLTNKESGCNHITCANCKKEWCWLCETKIVNPDNSSVPQHYKFGQCNGKQFDSSNEKIEKDCVGWMLYILCCDCIS